MKTRPLILVVEDDPAWQKSYKYVLDEMGHETVMCKSAEESRDLLLRRCFWLAIVDLSLVIDVGSDRSGYQVLDLIRKLNEGTAVVVVTGYGILEDGRDIVREYGAFDCISKPFDKTKLKELLNAALNTVMKRGLRKFGSTGDAISFLKGDREEGFFVNSALLALKPKGGYTGLKRSIESILDSFAPLLPRRDATLVMSIENVQSREKRETIALAHGEYWSKGLGFALHICLASQDATADAKQMLDAVGLDVGNLVETSETNNVRYVVVRSVDSDRADFVDWLT